MPSTFLLGLVLKSLFFLAGFVPFGNPLASPLATFSIRGGCAGQNIFPFPRFSPFWFCLDFHGQIPGGRTLILVRGPSGHRGGPSGPTSSSRGKTYNPNRRIVLVRGFRAPFRKIGAVFPGRGTVFGRGLLFLNKGKNLGTDYVWGKNRKATSFPIFAGTNVIGGEDGISGAERRAASVICIFLKTAPGEKQGGAFPSRPVPLAEGGKSLMGGLPAAGGKKKTRLHHQFGAFSFFSRFSGQPDSGWAGGGGPGPATEQFPQKNKQRGPPGRAIEEKQFFTWLRKRGAR